jgi:mRNA-degrading endonuclease RelE of RelBE toxin-antitoxin system
MGFKIQIEPEVYQDIQEGIDWYNQQGENLGYKFYEEIKNTLEQLSLNPFFQVRYDNVRCCRLKRFLYMIHFTVREEDKLVIVRNILNTSRDPQLWQGGRF